MAITIVVDTDLNAVQKIPAQVAPATNAFKGLQDQMAKMEQSTTASMAAMRAGMQGLAQQIRPLIFGQNELGASLIKTGQAAGATTAQLAKLSGVYGATGAAAKKAAEETTAATTKMGAGFQQATQAAKPLTAQMDDLTGALVAFVAAFKVGGVLGGFLQEATMTAARTETLGVVLMQVAKNAGITALEAGTARDRIKELGITTQEASSITARFIQANLGLENAIKLARVAQDAAVLANKNSSETLGGLVQGILTLQQETLRTYGIFVNLEQANKAFATANKRTVESLTVYEKQLIAFNATFARGVEISGAYTSALDTVGKKVTSLSRVVEESRNVLGAQYLPVFSRLVEGATSLLTGFQKLSPAVQTATAAILGGAFAIGTLTVAVAALVKVGQALAITSLFTGWGPVILAIGAATAGVIALSKVLGGVGVQDPATVLKNSLSAIDSRIASTQTLLSAQESSLAVMQKSLEQTPESKAGAEVITRQTARVEELRKALQALQVVREQVGKPVPLPPPKPPVEPPTATDGGAAEAAARARALVQLQQQEIRLEAEKLNALQAMRQIALEQDREAAITASTQTKRELDAIERATAIRRLDLSRLSAQEDLALQVTAAKQARDAKLDALTAEAAAAQAASGKSAEAAEAANKRLAAVATQRRTAEVDYQADLVEIRKKGAEAEAAYIKGITSLERAERAEQIQLAEQKAQREAQLRQEALQAQQAVFSAETALVQAQVDGLVLTREEGLAQIQAIQQREFANRRELLHAQQAEELRQLQERVKMEAATAEDITKLNTTHQTQLSALNTQEQALAQTHRNELLDGWREWVRDVQGALGNFLFEWMDGQIDSIKDLLDSLKSYFFRLIADMVAYAATRAIVVPIVGSFLGGFGGGGAAGAAGTALQGAGVLSQLLGIGGGGSAVGSAAQGFGIMDALGITTGLKTISAGLGVGVDMLTDALVMGAGRISQFFGGGAVGTWNTATTTVGGAVNLGGSAAGLAGGLAALGGGIYGALNAANTASRAAFAASAAAGALAAASTAAGAGLLGASAGTAALTGWSGVGLIAAAVMAVIGVVLDKVIKPAGPALAVGRPSGLGIGVQDGRLAVSGDLGSRVLRREGVDPGMARGVQAQLEEGLTNAVVRIVETINAVALDPAALLGPTQDALQRALANIRPINTANAKKMEQDITEQLRFVNVQIVAGMLGPLNEAFNQLRDQGDLQEQLDRLPATTAGLVEVFKTMNTQLAEMGASQNTDVLRQLSGVKNQVENFGNRIAGTAAQIAESIVNELVTSMQQTVVPTLAGQIRQFSGLMDSSFRALTELRATQQTLEGAGLQGSGVGAQIDRLTKAMSEQAERISTEIVSGALEDLAQELDVILIQPIRVQATTVNGLFTDSLAALNALWTEWHRLEGAGIDATRVREQFDQLLGGMLDSVQQITEHAFSGGNFTQFLNVLLSIPEALANMNPITQQMRQMGLVFAQVAGPIEEVIRAVSLELQTPAQRAAEASHRMFELREAIAQTGNAIDQALPLYGQLSQAIQANATAQIEAWNAWADEQSRVVNEAFDAQREALRTWVDESTQAWNDWAETQLDAVNQWAETSTKMINDWADSAQTVAGQLATVNDILLGEMSPAQQRGTLESQKAQLEAVVNATGSPEALTELISINQQLLELAKQSDDLALVMASQQALKDIQKNLQAQLAASTGHTDPVLAQIAIAQKQEDWLEYIGIQQKIQTEAITTAQAAQLEAIKATEDAQLTYLETTQEQQLKAIADAQADMIRAIKVDMVYQLQLVQYELQKMFAMQYKVLTGIDLAAPVHPSQMLTYDPATGSVRPPVLFQRGGIAGLASGLHYAQGGLVPVMAEPGETHWSGHSMAQDRALASVNAAFPRFGVGGVVPGYGSGDTVPMLVPMGTRFVNRTASRAMGFQNGGMVPSSSPSMPPIVIDLRHSVFGSPQDASKVRNILEREVVRIWEQYQRKTRVETRLH